MRLVVMSAPLDDGLTVPRITPFAGKGFWEIIFSPYARLSVTYKDAFTNIIYHWFGIGDETFRVISVTFTLLNIFFVYRFTAVEIGRMEAAIAVLLFGISHYGLWTANVAYYGDFYNLASFLSFYLLWEGFKDDRWWNWLGCAIFIFLNFTNCILGGNFIVPLLAVAFTLLLWHIKEDHALTAHLWSKARRFCIAFFIALAMGVGLYYIKDLNLPMQVYNLIVHHQTAGLDSLDRHSSPPITIASFLQYLHEVFVLFNFEYGENRETASGTTLGYWSYLCLFLAGMHALAKKSRKLFLCFMVVLLVPVLISFFVTRVVEVRYISFILPFYLIAAAAGFTHCLTAINQLTIPQTWRNSAVYTLAFLFFCWIIQTGFLFSPAITEQQFHAGGIKAVRNYLDDNIKPEDIILNVTQITELRGGYGDALNLNNYQKKYLEHFWDKHRLELLPHRKGRVGIWLICLEALDNAKLWPFYFPVGYSPKMVKTVHGMVLYYGEIELPDSDDLEHDKILITPFWLFVKAHELQLQNKLPQAEKYYLKFLEHGYNKERALFNLGLMYFKKFPQTALDYLEKAVHELEAPTLVPSGLDVSSWDTYLTDARGIPDKSIRTKALRYFFAEIHGVKTRTWFKEDLIAISPSEYASHYILPGLILYDLYKQTGNNSYLEISNQYLAKGIALYPEFRESIELLKTGGYSLDVPVFHLQGIHTSFPPLPIKDWKK